MTPTKTEDDKWCGGRYVPSFCPITSPTPGNSPTQSRQQVRWWQSARVADGCTGERPPHERPVAVLHPSEIGAGQILYVCATAKEFAATAPFGVAWSGASRGTFGVCLLYTSDAADEEDSV